MSVRRAVITVLVVIGSHGSLTLAQSNPSSPAAQEQRARAESPAGGDKGGVPSTPPNPRAETLKPTVEQEIEALKNRIEELESEVREARATSRIDGAADAAATRHTA